MNYTKAHNLSIIIPSGERGKKYKEWQSDQNGSTWKTQLRRNINFCIKSASTYEDFLLLMKVKGYEIKMESFNAHSTALWKHTLLHPVFVHRSKDVTGTDTYISRRCDKIFHPFLTIFDNLGCCLFFQSRYKIIFSHARSSPSCHRYNKGSHIHYMTTFPYFTLHSYSVMPKLKVLLSAAFLGINLTLTSTPLPLMPET